MSHASLCWYGHLVLRLVLLRLEGLVHSLVILVVEVRVAGLVEVVLRIVRVVGVRHPHEVRMPWDVVLSNPGPTTLGAATIQVAGHRIGVLLAFTLPVRLHPLDGIALWPDAHAAGILEDGRGDDGTQNKDG